MIWNGLEDSALSGLAELSFVGIFDIFDEVILLTILENGKLSVQDILELLDFEWRLEFIHALIKCSVEFGSVLLTDLADLGVAVSLLEVSLVLGIIVGSHLVHFLVGDCVENCSILISCCSHEWIKSSLKKGSLLVS